MADVKLEAGIGSRVAPPSSGDNALAKFSLIVKYGGLMQDGTAKPVSRDHVLERERNRDTFFSCLTGHKQG